MTCSIILPVFNSDSHIYMAIKSILSQTYRDFELIIVNDGSTDRSSCIIEYFRARDDRIRVINKKNTGIVDSLNIGLKHCNYNFIARMDSDDLMREDRLEQQLEFLGSNPHVGVVGSWVRLFGAKASTYRYFPDHDQIVRSLKYGFGSGFAHPSVMFNRNNIEDLFYSDRYAHVEDVELWFRLQGEGVKFANIQTCLTKYRVHADSISNKNALIQLKNRRQFRCRADTKEKILGLVDRVFLRTAFESKSVGRNIL